MDTIIDQGKKLHMGNLVTIQQRNKSKIKTCIHKTSRTTLINHSRKGLSPSTAEAKKRQKARSEFGNFDFKTQCFYC